MTGLGQNDELLFLRVSLTFQSGHSWSRGHRGIDARRALTPKRDDPSQYEFYGGKDQQDAPIWTRDFTRITPLLEGNNNMGCVTVTYNALLTNSFMYVTKDGNTCAPMNTYILESCHVTGPGRVVTYMEHFGQQAYCVNIPSKFISPDGTKAWLCYSAHFASNWNNENIGSNPSGSRYGLVFQELHFLDPLPGTLWSLRSPPSRVYELHPLPLSARLR